MNNIIKLTIGCLAVCATGVVCAETTTPTVNAYYQALAETPPSASSGLEIGSPPGQGGISIGPEYFTATPVSGGYKFIIPADTDCAKTPTAQKCWLYSFHHDMGPSTLSAWLYSVKAGSIPVGVQGLFAHYLSYNKIVYTGCKGSITGNDPKADPDKQDKANLILKCGKPSNNALSY